MKRRTDRRLYVLGIVILCFGLLSVHPGLPVCVVGVALIWSNW